MSSATATVTPPGGEDGGREFLARLSDLPPGKYEFQLWNGEDRVKYFGGVREDAMYGIFVSPGMEYWCDDDTLEVNGDEYPEEGRLEAVRSAEGKIEFRPHGATR